MKRMFARGGRWLLDASRLPVALAAWMGLVAWRRRKSLMSATDRKSTRLNSSH